MRSETRSTAQEQARERAWKWNLAHRYDMTVEEYDAMYLAQDGKCAICEQRAERLCVDHDHDTQAVRGLLCKLCNTGIGHLGDDPTRLLAAAAYLLQHDASYPERSDS